MNELADGCAELGLALSDLQLARLEEYAALLRKWNKTVNLISRRDIDRVIPRHLLDSLSGCPWIGAGPVLDVGSGAGLPGVPLAIALNEVSFTLCERMARRARFLHQTERALQLPNVQVVCADADALPNDELYSTVVARAVSGPQALWALLSNRLTPSGSMLIYTATQTDPEPQVESADEHFEGGVATLHRVRVPGMENAHTLCEIKKL